jgi:hypothetical protein
MSAEVREYPIMPHLGGEFLLWLWYRSETTGNRIDLMPEDAEAIQFGDEAAVDLWVDARIAMRPPDTLKATSVFTGENPANTPESKVAVRGGKILEELRIGMRTDGDLEFLLTLKGSALELAGLKLPATEGAGFEELVFERMSLIEEVDRVLQRLFQRFAAERTGDGWRSIVEQIYTWIYEDENNSSDE